MLVLSFDIGSKNLAACGLEVGGGKGPGAGAARIVAWRVVDLEAEEGARSLADAVVRALDREFSGRAWDRVLVENQLGLRNVKMKSIQAMVHTYFAARQPGASVEYVAPAQKVRYAERVLGLERAAGASPMPYRRRKAVVVEAAEAILPEAVRAEHLARAKKDDLCDCLVQALAKLAPPETAKEFVRQS